MSQTSQPSSDPRSLIRYAGVALAATIILLWAIYLVRGPLLLIGLLILAGLLADEDAQTRFNAAYALARFGARADEAVPALARALKDSNRYVRNHSAEALRHIGTPAAQQALMDFLLVSRWCPITTKESTF